MNALTQELVELLSLEKIEENIFRGQSRNLVGKRVFGGQVLGQALRAASYTTDRPAHSLHAYPAPESLKSEAELKKMMVEFVPENVRASFMRDRHVEIRPINPQNPYQPQPEAPVYAHYIRTHDRIAAEVDETSLHQAIAAFYSDFTLMTTALRPHGLSYLSPSLQCASIDHAMYFHKPFRVDDWMLYDMDATVSASSRGLNFGRMWQNGELVCSTTQEGLIRLREIEAQ